MRPLRADPAPRSRDAAGAASVEQIGLLALIALLLCAAIASVTAAGELSGGRELGSALARRIVCGPHLPDDCNHHPAVPAYGWPLARLVRALAPAPLARLGPDGEPLVPVDFRRCRQPTCAVPLPGAAGAHLTVSNRRTTAFTEVRDNRTADGTVTVIYWLYRPGLPWERVVHQADGGDIEAAGGVEVLVSDDPALVPLETLPGRNHYDFPAVEEPPWRWRVRGTYPGWSS